MEPLRLEGALPAHAGVPCLGRVFSCHTAKLCCNGHKRLHTQLFSMSTY